MCIHLMPLTCTLTNGSDDNSEVMCILPELKKTTDTKNNDHQRPLPIALQAPSQLGSLTPCKVTDSATTSERFSCFQRSHSEPRRGSTPSVLANGPGRQQALPKCWLAGP